MLTGRDDRLLERFVCGVLPQRERAEIARRVAADAALAERLHAIEEAIVLSFLDGTLERALHDAFAASLAASPERRRRVAETAALLATLHEMRGDESAPRFPARRRATPWIGRAPALAAAAIVALALLGGWLVGRQLDTPAAPSEPSGAAGAQVQTVELAPTFRRDGERQNIVRRVATATAVRLVGRIPIDSRGLAALTADIRDVDGRRVPAQTAPTFRRNETSIEYSWTIPMSSLPRGDYIVTIVAAVASGARETIDERFFSVVD